MHIEPFFDPDTSSLTYLVYDEASGDAVVIDPVLDYCPVAAQTDTRSVGKVVAFLRERKLNLKLVLETHVHADHLSAAQHLKKLFSVPVAITRRVTEVQKLFLRLFNLEGELTPDGSQFDRLIDDGEQFSAGSLRLEALPTPGHTPGCLTYIVHDKASGDAAFVGDSLFIEDYGTGRCDFPGGNPSLLYDSVHERLYQLPKETRIFVGHDYQPGGRKLRCETSVATSREHNVHIRESTLRDDFVCFRSKRDATLTPPRLLYPSVQVNINAGRLPAPSKNGLRYLRIPLNTRQPTGDDGDPAA